MPSPFTPTVTNTVKRPDGSAATDAVVSIELAGENGKRIAGYVTAADYTIEGLFKPAVNSTTAVWSQALVPNSLIAPAGTVYKIIERVDGKANEYFITVTDVAGPLFVEDILTDAPGALAPTALAAEIARAEAAEAQRVETANGGKEDYDNIGDSTGAVALDLADGNVQRIVLTGNVTLSVTGATNAKACSLTLVIVQDATGGRTVTWPAGTKTDNGIGIVVSTAANAVDVVCLLTVDGGTTWYVFLAGQAMA